MSGIVSQQSASHMRLCSASLCRAIPARLWTWDMGRPVRAAKPYAIVHLVNHVNRRSQLANHAFNEHHLILPYTYVNIAFVYKQ